MNSIIRPAIVVLAAASIAATGCKEEAVAQPEAKSAAPVTSESAAPEATSEPSATPTAAAPKCPAGFHGNASPPFCIKMPEGYTAKEPKIIGGKVGELQFGGPANLSVVWTDTDFDSCVKQMEAEAVINDLKIVERGDTADGGKFIRSRNDTTESYQSVIKGSDGLTLSCDAMYDLRTATNSVVVDACKSLTVPTP